MLVARFEVPDDASNPAVKEALYISGYRRLHAPGVNGGTDLSSMPSRNGIGNVAPYVQGLLRRGPQATSVMTRTEATKRSRLYGHISNCPDCYARSDSCVNSKFLSAAGKYLERL